MATVEKWVDTDVAAGGDGSEGDPYDTLSTWEANTETGSGTDDFIVNCAGVAADTTAVTVDFATNISTGSITIRGNRNDAAGFYDGNLVISDQHYRLSPGNVGMVLDGSEGNFTVDGIQLIAGHTTGFGSCISPSGNGWTIRNCRVFNSSGTDYGIGRNANTISTNGATVENNLVVGFDVAQVQLQISQHVTATVNVLHNTAYGDASSNGLVVSQASGGVGVVTLNLKANAVANNSAGGGLVVSLAGGTPVITYADNAFEEAESTTDEIVLGTETDAWTDPGTATTNDFTVKDTSSSLYNAVNPTLLAEDIVEFTRDGTNHDVGAFELQEVVVAATKRYTLTTLGVG